MCIYNRWTSSSMCYAPQDRREGPWKTRTLQNQECGAIFNSKQTDDCRLSAFHFRIIVHISSVLGKNGLSQYTLRVTYALLTSTKILTLYFAYACLSMYATHTLCPCLCLHLYKPACLTTYLPTHLSLFPFSFFPLRFSLSVHFYFPSYHVSIVISSPESNILLFLLHLFLSSLLYFVPFNLL